MVRSDNVVSSEKTSVAHTELSVTVNVVIAVAEAEVESGSLATRRQLNIVLGSPYAWLSVRMLKSVSAV